MSKISLSPDSNGTGIFTIASPNSNTNRTLTLPDDTGTIVTNSGNQAGSFTTLNTSGAVVFNDAGADVDFRVEGDTDANLLFVDASTDRVGIGTSSPSDKLEITGGKIIVNKGDFSGGGTGAVIIRGTTTSAKIIELGLNETSDYGVINVVQSGVGGLPLAINTNGGNVGIGTSSPTEKLTVAGAGLFSGALADDRTSAAVLDFSSGISRIISYGASGTGGIIAFRTASGGASSTERMRIDSSGNVTIGPSGFISNDSLQTTASLRGSKTGGVSNTRLQFVQTWNSVLYTASIEGREISTLGAASNGLEFFSGRFSGGAVIDHVLTLNSQQRLFRTMGTTASAANAFLDSGNSNNLLRSTSSLRYKTDIENVEQERSDAILNFRPVWYRSIAEADKKEWSWYGLIAEEVAEIEPRLVHWGYADDAYEEIEVDVEREHTVTDEDGNETTETFVAKELKKELKPDAQKVPDGVQYDRLTVLLLDVVKRQDASIKALEARIAALETGA